MAKNNIIQSVTSSVPTGTFTPTASSIAGWDTHANLSANSVIEGYATTATAAGTTTLTVADKEQQFFTGSTTQTVKLPVTSTLVNGQSFEIRNLSSGNVTVQSSGANTLQVMTQDTVLVATVISTSGTGTASWSYTYYPLTAPVSTSITIAGDSGSMTGSSLSLSGGSLGLTTSASGTTMNMTGTLIVADSGTSKTSFTAYAPIAGGTTSTGALQSMSTGLSSTNYALTSNGSSALPSFQPTIGGPGLVLIQSQTISTPQASITFTTGITSLYTNYFLVIDNAIADQAADIISVQLSSDGGANYITSGYVAGFIQYPYNSASPSGSQQTSGFRILNAGTNNTMGSGRVYIFGLTDGSYPMCVGLAYVENGTKVNWLGAAYQSAGAMNALRVIPVSGNIKGTYSLYGFTLL